MFCIKMYWTRVRNFTRWRRSFETSKNDSRTSGIPAGLVQRATAYFWFSHKVHWLDIFQTSEWYIRTSDFYNPLARRTSAFNLKFQSLWTPAKLLLLADVDEYSFANAGHYDGLRYNAKCERSCWFLVLRQSESMTDYWIIWELTQINQLRFSKINFYLQTAPHPSRNTNCSHVKNSQCSAHQSVGAANFDDRAHHKIWGLNLCHSNIYILTHEYSSTGFE